MPACLPLRSSADALSVGRIRAAIDERVECKDRKTTPLLSRSLLPDEGRLVALAWRTLANVPPAFPPIGPTPLQGNGLVIVMTCIAGRYGGRFVVDRGLGVVAVLDHEERWRVRACLCHELTHAAMFHRYGDKGTHGERFFRHLERVYRACGVSKHAALAVESHGVPGEWLRDMRRWA